MPTRSDAHSSDTASSDPVDPTAAELMFYLASGAFLGLVLVATIGLSIYGFQTSADSRAIRTAAAVSAREEAAIDNGADIFRLRCSSCHGVDGQGLVGPSFVGVTERIPDAADHEAVVRAGRLGMPSFQGMLSDAEIEMVVRFEREVLDSS